MNAIVYDALKAALSAVRHLNDQGATVFSVELHAGRPRIQIDGEHGFLRGSLRTRQRLPSGLIKVCLVTTVHGCQVEWNELYEPAREAHPA